MNRTEAVEGHSRQRDSKHARVITGGWFIRLLRELGYSVTREDDRGAGGKLVVDERDIDVVTAIRILEAFTFDSSESLDGVMFEANDVNQIALTHFKRGEVTAQGRAMLACVGMLGPGWDEESLTYRPGDIVGEERNALVAFMQACGRGDVVAQLWKEK